MIASWTVCMDDATHSVVAEMSPWTQKLKISWDGHPIHISTVWWPLGDIHAFERKDHSFVVSVKGAAFLGGYFALTMDSVAVTARGGSAGPRQAPPSTVRFVQEQNVVKAKEVVSVEDFPVDNTFGTSEVVSERQVSKESMNELTLETTDQLSGTLRLEFFTALKADVSAQLSNKTGTRVGEKMTVSQTLTFKVSAGKSVVHQVIWRRKVRSGEYVYRTESGRQVTVPYRVHYGLSPEVRTLEAPPAER